MRFTALQIGNWRNFEKAEVELQDRVFLEGPNASGKSNLLDVFRFLHDVVAVGGGFQEAVRRRGGVSSLRSLAARRYSDIVIKASLGTDRDRTAWEYEVCFNQDNTAQPGTPRPLIKKETVTHHGKILRNRPDESDAQDPERLTQTYLEQVHANKDFREVAEFFSTVRYLHIVPQLVRDPDRSKGMKDDPYGGDFIEQIARTQKRTREAWLRRIQDALRVAVPQLKELTLQQDSRGVPHLQGRYEHWRPQGAWQTEELFSDGTLRLMGLLWAALDGSGPLLLEEPEISLHPEVVRYIPQMFFRLQRKSGRQFVVSTHSLEVVGDEGVGVDEVLLLQPGSEGTVLLPASRLKDVKSLLEGGLSLAEAVMPHTRPERAEQLPLLADE
ncbi:MAG: AAA family ATPase [Nitrospirae bacterium]|nr:AAA family ATPase [Nitrospirota bacterium]